jgi:hypothetical protein
MSLPRKNGFLSNCQAVKYHVEGLMSADRDKINKAFGDAVYDAWRAGLNPDHVDPERIADNFYQTGDAEQAAAAEVDRLRRQQQYHEDDGA